MNQPAGSSSTWQGEMKSQDNIRKISCRDTFGDKLQKHKKRGNIRIVFQNINGLGTTDETCKRDLIREFITLYNIDCFAMAEVNINWKIVAKKESLNSLAKQWFQNSRVVTSHNAITSTRYHHQQGGVGMIVAGDMALRIKECTRDEYKLGRWTSTLLRGQQNCYLRLVSVYVPHEPKGKNHGNLTVYSQQQAALLKLKRVSSVMEAFWKDFWTEVDSWIENGEQILVGGDWNEDVYNEELVQKFSERNMIPVITTKHQDKAPPTYNNGSYPIDEFFATQSLQIESCGYLEHGRNTGDHCPLWVEVNKQKVLGTNPPPVPKQQSLPLHSGSAT